MKKFLLIAVLALAACAPMPRANPLSRAQADLMPITAVTVSAEGAQFENERAAVYASQITADVQGAIEGEFSHRRGRDGATIEVTLSRLNIADSRRTAFGSDQSKLLGQARVIDPAGTVLAVYPLHIISGQAAKTRTGALLSTAIQSSDGYYRDLVKGFASDLRTQFEK